MPYLKLETNVEIPGSLAEALLRELTSAVADSTGKPEAYIQVAVAGGRHFMMAGKIEPTAHVDFRAIELSDARTAGISGAVCAVIENRLGIDGKRIFISFASYAGTMWGYDGKTF